MKWRWSVLLAAMIVAMAPLALTGVEQAAEAANQLNPVRCPTSSDGFTCKGTRKADSIAGTARADQIYGLGGNDKINGKASDDRYFLRNNWGADTVTDTGGSIDRLRAESVTSRMTVNLTSSLRPEVTDGSNTVNWGEDAIEGAFTGTGNDVIRGSTSDNVLAGDAGNDTYRGFSGKFGVDQVADNGYGLVAGNAGTADVLDLSNFKLSDVGSWWAADDSADADNLLNFLVLDFRDGREIQISDYFDNTATTATGSGGGPGLIETIKFADDPSVDLAQARGLVGPAPQVLCPNVSDGVSCVGTQGRESMQGTEGHDEMYGLGGNDTTHGKGADDYYFYGPGWGDDTLTDTGGTSDAVWFPGLPSDLTIDLASKATPEVSDGANTANWSDNVVEVAVSGAGNDVIKGNPTSNYLAGAAGDDTYGGFTPGFGGDLVDDSLGGQIDQAGAADALNLTGFQLSDVTGWHALSPPSSTSGKVSDLGLQFGDGSLLLIQGYFSGTSAFPQASGRGAGYIETIRFSDDSSVDLAQVRNVAVHDANEVQCPTSTDGFTCQDSINNDRMIGTEEYDRIGDTVGDDFLDGKGGGDSFVYSDAWGESFIADSGGLDLVRLDWVTSDVTMNLRVTAGPEVTGGANTVNWASATEIEGVVSGAGDDTLNAPAAAGGTSLRPGALLGSAGGTDTYQGFAGGFGVTQIRDNFPTSGPNSSAGDALNLSSFSASQVSRWGCATTDADVFCDALRIKLANGSEVQVIDYFDNTADTLPELRASSPGGGLIERIVFAGSTLGFEDVKQLVREAETSSTSATGTQAMRASEQPSGQLASAANDAASGLEGAEPRAGDPSSAGPTPEADQADEAFAEQLRRAGAITALPKPHPAEEANVADRPTEASSISERSP